ncbi:MAG TPA: hypothetical protein VK213_02265 [Bacteroidales bacterium]|nr:hypothetical protein [Bacteroidales bacterium]
MDSRTPRHQDTQTPRHQDTQTQLRITYGDSAQGMLYNKKPCHAAHGYVLLFFSTSLSKLMMFQKTKALQLSLQRLFVVARPRIELGTS